MIGLDLNPGQTALVLIDLEHGIVSREVAPHAASDVVARCASLAAGVRSAGGTVVYVHVLLNEILRLPADLPNPAPSSPPPPGASEIVPEAGRTPSDLVVRKRQWGAFFGTDLDLLLRRRGITTILLGGIATNLGVESTARAAFDAGYQIIFAEDAMTSVDAELHHFAVTRIFPRMGRVRSTTQILDELKR